MKYAIFDVLSGEILEGKEYPNFEEARDALNARAPRDRYGYVIDCVKEDGENLSLF